MADTQMGKWVRRSEQEWRLVLSRFSGRGLSVTAFCRREAISVANFYRWRALLEENAAQRHGVHDKDTARFVDLGALAPGSGDCPQLDLKLDLGDGLTLHLVRRCNR